MTKRRLTRPEMSDFMKRSIEKVLGSERVPRWRNLALEAPGPEMSEFIKRSIKKRIGL